MYRQKKYFYSETSVKSACSRHENTDGKNTFEWKINWNFTFWFRVYRARRFCSGNSFFQNVSLRFDETANNEIPAYYNVFSRFQFHFYAHFKPFCELRRHSETLRTRTWSTATGKSVRQSNRVNGALRGIFPNQNREKFCRKQNEFRRFNGTDFKNKSRTKRLSSSFPRIVFPVCKLPFRSGVLEGIPGGGYTEVYGVHPFRSFRS